MVKLEQSLEQCLEKRMDGSCRSHPPVEDQLLLWTGKTYDPTTHQIKSRLTPAYNLTLKQGLVAKGDGVTGYISYSLAMPTSTTKMRWLFRLSDVSSVSKNDRIASQWNSSTGKSWAFSFGVSLEFKMSLATSGGGAAYSAIPTNGGGAYIPSSGDLVDIVFDSGIITVVVNGTTSYTVDVSGTQTSLYSNGNNTLICFASEDGMTQNASISMCDLSIWINNILDTDAPVFKDALEGGAFDQISGTQGTVAGDIDFTARSDYASFYCEEYGFAVKTGKIYPKNYAGTGYAGLVGEPDAVYQGLIATKGQPEIGTKQYLGTEYDFGDAEAITDAGISWDGWNGKDTKGDTVGTAETDLDTDYYNAIVASLMTNTSIAGYAGTSNVSKRLFFKVADRVMKDDGSFLAESGRVQEIMVYKRDLTEAEILRVQKYCREVTE